MSALPNTLYRAEQVRELDRRAIEEHGIPGFDLMQRAAAAAYGVLRKRWPDARHLHIVCGPGNNGGDGCVIGMLALAEGLDVTLELLCDPGRLKGDALRALQAYKQAGGYPAVMSAPPVQADVVVDALLGTGTDRAVEGAFLDAVQRINAAAQAGAGVLGVDIPSGLHADTGQVLGAAVRADTTVTFIGMKVGLLIGSGPACAGELVFDDLAVPARVYDELPPAVVRIGPQEYQRCLPPRKRDAHKNRHGHVLCIGGDYGTAGAIRLAAEAALRSGAGLVSVATRPEAAVAMSQARPELMCRGVESPEDLDSLLSSTDAVLLGPGLGQGDWGRVLWAKVIDSRLPLVVDADGLNLLAANPGQRTNWVLTPHPGEAARLLEASNADIQADRLGAVQGLVTRYGGVAVLKGAGTLVAVENQPVTLCTAGNPGMAVGGMGDLLGGVIVALLAQGLGLYDAARLAVDVHARAGDLAAKDGERGLLPSDLLPHLRSLVNPSVGPD